MERAMRNVGKITKARSNRQGSIAAERQSRHADQRSCVIVPDHQVPAGQHLLASIPQVKPGVGFHVEGSSAFLA